MNPIASGGYAWVVFTSRRMYGNVATIPPFCSDPRGVDLIKNITPKKLWVAAVDLNQAPGTDASHPAFYLPAQELLAGNARGFWVLDPCQADGTTCTTGDQCCNGYCEADGDGGALVCSTMPPNEHLLDARRQVHDRRRLLQRGRRLPQRLLLAVDAGLVPSARSAGGTEISEQDCRTVTRHLLSTDLTPPAPPLPASARSVLRTRCQASRGRERGEEAADLPLPPLSGPTPHATTSPSSPGRARERGAGGVRSGKRRETGMRKQVSEMRKHRRVEQVLSREESTPGKPIPCAAWGDPRGEA